MNSLLPNRRVYLNISPMSLDCGSIGLLTFLIIICHYASTVTSQVECNSPAGIANGRLRSSGPYFNQSEAVYDCDSGYAIVGSAGGICWPLQTPQWQSVTGGAFPPRCDPPPPEDNRQTENNYYSGMPEWLQILLGVLLGLLLLLLLLLLILALWYLCCRACCCCCASSGESSSSSSSTNKEVYSEAITTTNTSTDTTTTGTGTGGGNISTHDVGTQVRMQDPVTYPPTVTYYPNYQQKPPAGTTITKIEYVEETQKNTGGSNNTSSNKTSTNNTSTNNTSSKTTNGTSTNQVTPWMPHSQPTRNDVYHAKSSTK